MSDYDKVKGLYLSEQWDYETPDWLFDFLNELFNFRLDAAANIHNTKLPDFINEETNALTVSWKNEGKWWLNPPWGRLYTEKTGYSIGDWMRKAFVEYLDGNEGVAIVSARCDTRWWHNNVKFAPYVWFPKGRVKFLLEGEVKVQPNFPSACIIFVRELTDEQVYQLNQKGWLVKRYLPTDK